MFDNLFAPPLKTSTEAAAQSISRMPEHQLGSDASPIASHEKEGRYAASKAKKPLAGHSYSRRDRSLLANESFPDDIPDRG